MLNKSLLAAAVAMACTGCASVVNLDFNPTYQNNRDWVKQACPEKATGHFKHVVMIVLENENDHAKPSERADTQKAFVEALKGLPAETQAGIGVAHFENFHGLFHPSYSNYLAMVSGSALESHHDKQQNYVHPTIAEQLEESANRLRENPSESNDDKKRAIWKNYAEGYPGNSDSCFTGSLFDSTHYVRKHVPFLSFNNLNGKDCTDHIISIHAHKDTNIACNSMNTKGIKSCNGDGEAAAANFLDRWKESKPAYAIYTPDQNHNGHDTGLKAATAWLHSFLKKTLSDAKFTSDTLVIVTFDESNSNFGKDEKSTLDHTDPENDNQIDTFFIGNMVKTLTDSATRYNHFNVLRTIEENFGLCPVGEMDRVTLPISENIWTKP